MAQMAGTNHAAWVAMVEAERHHRQASDRSEVTRRPRWWPEKQPSGSWHFFCVRDRVSILPSGLRVSSATPR